MKILLVAIGSSGDVHPLVGIGQELRRRGHEVTVIASQHFEPLVRRVGMGFAALGTDEDYLNATNNPDLWHPRKGTELVLKFCCVRSMRDLYQIIADAYQPGETLVISGGLGTGARIAQEKLGVPMITTFLQPLMFRSVHDSPRFGWVPLPNWAPSIAKRMFYRAVDFYIDRLIASDTNAFRSELGLPPVNRMMRDWWMSPELVIGLFPDWFGPPQPDWPAQTIVTGFPMYDEADAVEIPQAAKDFFDGGEPPIVFTPGSAMRFGRSFFEASADACRVLGRRGVLLTRFSEHVPQRLPDGVVHFDYLPLGSVLPRAAAMVHHGGMGTMAQTLRAGIPHLVMPMAIDQPDNARRLVRLGVARSLKPRAYRARHVARTLDYLLNSKDVAHACRMVARKFDGTDPLAGTCDAVEAFATRTL